MNNENICTICLDPIDIKENHDLRCGHVFHTLCIIRWFRQPYTSGNCPLCLDNPTKNTKYINYYGYNFNSHIINLRCTSLKKYCKKNNENKNLKKNIDKLLQFEKEFINIKNDIKIFKKNENYINITNKSRELSKKLRKKDNQIKNIKCKIISNYPTLFL